ncbi:MAG: protein kinase family protein [Spirochaetales bacterium]|nr:protein kinase family protein [Spirochaetales bacterium]
MNFNGATINNCYLVRYRRAEDELTETWEAHALFSANIFRLIFLKTPFSDIDPHAYDEFRRVASILCKVNNPHIETVIETGVYENHAFISILDAQGLSLSDRLKEGIVLPYKTAIRFIYDMVGGLVSLEIHGLRHGLLCPKNIWVSTIGEITLQIKACYLTGILPLGEGMKFIHQLEECFRFLQASPSQGYNPSLSADIYSIGLTFYMVLFGEKTLLEEKVKFLANRKVIESSSIPKKAKILLKKLIFTPESYPSILSIRDEIYDLLPKQKNEELLHTNLSSLQTRFRGQAISEIPAYAEYFRMKEEAPEIEVLGELEQVEETPGEEVSIRGAKWNLGSFLRAIFARKKSLSPKKITGKSKAPGFSSIVPSPDDRKKQYESGFGSIIRSFGDYFLGSRKPSIFNIGRSIKKKAEHKHTEGPPMQFKITESSTKNFTAKSSQRENQEAHQQDTQKRNIRKAGPGSGIGSELETQLEKITGSHNGSDTIPGDVPPIGEPRAAGESQSFKTIPPESIQKESSEAFGNLPKKLGLFRRILNWIKRLFRKI